MFRNLHKSLNFILFEKQTVNAIKTTLNFTTESSTGVPENLGTAKKFHIGMFAGGNDLSQSENDYSGPIENKMDFSENSVSVGVLAWKHF